ncbi:MAG: CARDB domain-containing protein [Chloroflexota bacterium]
MYPLFRDARRSLTAAFGSAVLLAATSLPAHAMVFPDLTIKYVGQTTEADGSHRAAFVVKNQGLGEVLTTKAKIFKSTDPNNPKLFTLNNVKAGDTRTLYYDLGKGECFAFELGARVDFENQITETNEDNNLTAADLKNCKYDFAVSLEGVQFQGDKLVGTFKISNLSQYDAANVGYTTVAMSEKVLGEQSTSKALGGGIISSLPALSSTTRTVSCSNQVPAEVCMNFGLHVDAAMDSNPNNNGAGWK